MEEPESWFHATRHCLEDEQGSDVARVLSGPEAQFVAGLSDSESPRWVMGYFDDGEWNVDWAALNLWQIGQPGNVGATYKLCAAQGGDDDALRFKTEYCSKKLPFVCKLCPSAAANDQVVLPASLPAVDAVPTLAKVEAVAVDEEEEAVAVVREARDVSNNVLAVTSTTTTTDAPDELGAADSGESEAEDEVEGAPASPPAASNSSIGFGNGVRAAGASIDIVDTSASATGPSASTAQTATIAAAAVAAVVLFAVIGAVIKFKSSPKPTSADVPSSGHQGAIDLTWDDEMNTEVGP